MTDPESKPRFRWWQFRRGWLRFSLRSLLVLLTVACLGLGWLANRANQQRQVVRWVTELGGSVHYDYELDENGETLEDVEPPGPDWLRDFIGVDYFATVVEVNLSDTQASDLTPLANLADIEVLSLVNAQVRDVTPLANLTDLKSLHLEGTHVSDLTPLANLTNLERLFLDCTQVSDLTPLSILTNLVWLQLVGTQVRDVTPLADLTNLAWLGLDGTQVSDLTPLAKLTNLNVLSLAYTKVSNEEREMLKRSLPGLTIWSNE